MTQKFENQPINYARYKTNSMDSMTNERGKWECKRKLVTRGYDAVLGKWDVVDTHFDYIPMESVGCFKEVIQTIYVKKVALGEDFREVVRWFKLRRKIIVSNKNNNIFLTKSGDVSDRVFMSDLTTTTPMNLNYVPEGIRVEKLDQKVLSQAELQNLERILEDEKIYIKPFVVSEMQNGELRLEA